MSLAMNNAYLRTVFTLIAILLSISTQACFLFFIFGYRYCVTAKMETKSRSELNEPKHAI